MWRLDCLLALKKDQFDKNVNLKACGQFFCVFFKRASIILIAKLNFQQSSVSRDPSDIILTC